MFVLAVPLIAISAFLPHVRMFWAIVVPFCIFILLMIPFAQLIAGCLLVAWSLLGLVSLVVVACAKERAIFRKASVVFVIVALLNIVGGAFFFSCFQLSGVH